MNDETHGSGTGERLTDSVLRPFTPPEPPPLPPIEPSKVVPDPPAGTEEPPQDAPVPPPPPVEALGDDPWAPQREPDATPEPEPTDDEATTDDEAITHGATTDEVGSEPAPDAAPPVAAAPPAKTITLPRKPFLIGLGVLLAAVALFAALWQTSGDDAPEAATDVAVADGDEPVVVDDDSGVGDEPAPAEEPDSAVDELTGDLADAEAEIASLEEVVQSLEERPPPALDGSMLRRIVVGADAKFVSALPESVAVVGAFGGVSLIDPETNRVVANGNVADAATRVMRTPSSVWLTNYADNQLIRVDPATNTVVATFPFEGPDGIDKDGDSLIVASFDGEFVARVNPGDGATLSSVDVGGRPTDVIAHVDHGLWAAVFDSGEIIQIDPDTFEIVRRVTVGQGPVSISADPSFLWVANHDEGTLAKVDPVSGEVVFTVAVGDGPTESAFGGGSVWVTVTDDGDLVEIDAGTGQIISRTPLGGASAGGGPTGISFAEGTLWVAMQGEQSVVRIDLR